MGLNGQSSAIMDDSRRLIKLGRELLVLNPPWRQRLDPWSTLSTTLDQLESALKNADGRLMMGLLGGTGVGKSTLISALAGHPISKSSAIRPTTQRPVIYHHVSFPPPASLDASEVVHELKVLKDLAIIDFPDFDSLEAAHRQIVLSHLDDLDLIVWVTDPNKYADRRFYELMSQVNGLSEMSQVVLLNKRDQLAQPDAITEIMADLQQTLGKYSARSKTSAWAVSAAEALAAPGDPKAGGLGPLRDFMAGLQEVKQRKAVESGNLQARNTDFLQKIATVTAPDIWLADVKKLNELADNFNPGPALKADLAAINTFKAPQTAIQLTLFKKKAQGLLALMTDISDFTLRRFQASEEILENSSPTLQAAGFIRYLEGRLEDLRLLAEVSKTSEAEFLKQSEGIFKTRLATAYGDLPKRPRSFPLYLWPIIWGILLVWAEAGGSYSPSAITAAALRSLVPWLIFSVLGDFIIGRFIWFRAKRRYERAFDQALSQAAADHEVLAENIFMEPANKIIAERITALELLADIMKSDSGGHPAP